MTRGKAFREIFRHLEPNNKFKEEAQHFIESQLVTGSQGYLAIHVRRGDFLFARCKRWKTVAHRVLNKNYVCPSDDHIVDCIKKTNFSKIYLATTLDDRRHMVAMLNKHFPQAKVYTYVSLRDSISEKDTDVRSIIEQLICEHAHTFIGNYVSTWSSTVFNRRLLKGVDRSRNHRWGFCSPINNTRILKSYSEPLETM